MITEDAYKRAADLLGCDIAAIKAVAEVESSGEGFLATGEPKILFEPHIFWKELKKAGIDPNQHVKGNEDILYPVWHSKPYGKYSQQHLRLAKATLIDRNAALKSASWGKFQIMGFNYAACGFSELQDFINAMYKSEDEHLAAFVNYIIVARLADELRLHAWVQFAAAYNGPGYLKNSYPTKLRNAYIKYS